MLNTVNYFVVTILRTSAMFVSILQDDIALDLKGLDPLMNILFLRPAAKLCFTYISLFSFCFGVRRVLGQPM